MATRRVLLSVAFALVVAVPPAAAEDAVAFRYHDETGSSNRYRIKFNQEMDFGGSAMGQIADLEVTVKCTAATDSTSAMELTFDKVDISRQAFDNMSADPIAELLPGQGVTFTADGVGEVSDVKPVTYFDGWEQAQQFVESLVKGWYARLPGTSVPVGGTWAEKNKKDKGVGGMDVTTNAEYKFKEKKTDKGRECALATGEIKSVFSGQSVNQMGSYEVAGNGSGTVEFAFDPATTVLVRLKVKMNVDIKLSPESGAANAVETHVSYHVERELL